MVVSLKDAPMPEIIAPKRFLFFLVPRFSLVALACAIDALRTANAEASEPVFQWQLVGEEAGIVRSSSGVELEAVAMEPTGAGDAIAVCGGDNSHNYENDNVDRWLKDSARRGALVGSISDGAYVVAQAGLFNGTRSTIHWKCQSAYRERFPDLDITTSIIEIDDRRFSCAGGTASLDLILHFVMKALGPDIVGRIADNYFHDFVRGDDQQQHMINAFRYAARNRRLSKALLSMEANLESPMPIRRIADDLGLSHRQLDRLFRRYLDISPGAHYRELRLARAAGLVRQTGLSIGEIAAACGFQSASHLGLYFKKRYGQTPGKYRFGSA